MGENGKMSVFVLPEVWFLLPSCFPLFLTVCSAPQKTGKKKMRENGKLIAFCWVSRLVFAPMSFSLLNSGSQLNRKWEWVDRLRVNVISMRRLGVKDFFPTFSVLIFFYLFLICFKVSCRHSVFFFCFFLMHYFLPSFCTLLIFSVPGKKKKNHLALLGK